MKFEEFEEFENVKFIWNIIKFPLFILKIRSIPESSPWNNKNKVKILFLVCGGNISAESGSLTSPFARQTCQWKIRVASDKRIKFLFETVQSGLGGDDCLDFVQISSKTYDGPRICGQNPTLNPIIVNENEAEIIYVIGSLQTSSRLYFRLYFKQIPKNIN